MPKIAKKNYGTIELNPFPFFSEPCLLKALQGYAIEAENSINPFSLSEIDAPKKQLHCFITESACCDPHKMMKVSDIHHQVHAIFDDDAVNAELKSYPSIHSKLASLAYYPLAILDYRFKALRMGTLPVLMIKKFNVRGFDQIKPRRNPVMLSVAGKAATLQLLNVQIKKAAAPVVQNTSVLKMRNISVEAQADEYDLKKRRIGPVETNVNETPRKYLRKEQLSKLRSSFSFKSPGNQIRKNTNQVTPPANKKLSSYLKATSKRKELLGGIDIDITDIPVYPVLFGDRKTQGPKRPVEISVQEKRESMSEKKIEKVSLMIPEKSISVPKYLNNIIDVSCLSTSESLQELLEKPSQELPEIPSQEISQEEPLELLENPPLELSQEEQLQPQTNNEIVNEEVEQRVGMEDGFKFRDLILDVIRGNKLTQKGRNIMRDFQKLQSSLGTDNDRTPSTLLIIPPTQLAIYPIPTTTPPQEEDQEEECGRKYTIYCEEDFEILSPIPKRKQRAKKDKISTKEKKVNPKKQKYAASTSNEADKA